MMSATAERVRAPRCSRRPARYVLRREGDLWRLYFRTTRASVFTDAGQAFLTAEHLAQEAAALGHQAYLVIDFADGGVEIRRLRRLPGHRGVLMRRRWVRRPTA